MKVKAATISQRNTYSASASSSDVSDVRAAVHLMDKKSRICEEFGRGCHLFLRSATKKLNICPWVGMGWDAGGGGGRLRAWKQLGEGRGRVCLIGFTAEGCPVGSTTVIFS